MKPLHRDPVVLILAACSLLLPAYQHRDALKGALPKAAPAVAPGELRGLVTTEAAAQLEEFYADFATVVRAGALKSTGSFREAHQLAGRAFGNASKLKGLGIVSTQIQAKLADAIDLEDVPLDDAMRTKLADALDALSKDFAG